jgi:methionyl-tRNA formyltransferase
MAYGRILPQAVLDAPRRGCMNLHASLLPKLRGAAPINWAIARGEKETGICLMQMDAGMDTGAVLSSHAISIGPDETAGELSDRLARLAAQVVRDDLLRAVEGKLIPQPQAEAQATYAPVMTKDDGRIDWSGRLKVLRTRLHGGDVASPGGTVVIADSKCVLVACGAGLIELVSLQLPGKKAMPAGAMVVGRTLRAGDVLGVGSD